MGSQVLVITPLFDDTMESAELGALRDAVLAVDGVARIYPPATVSSKFVRAVGVATATIRSAVEQLLLSQDDDDSALHASSVKVEESASVPPEQKTLPQSEEESVSISVRIGTSAGANVPETTRAVARAVRAQQGENVAVNVDVVHI